MDSYGKKAGKGALIQEELSGTLGVSQDQYLFQPIAYGIDTYNQAAEEEIMQTIRTNCGGDCIPKVVYPIGVDLYNQAITGDKTRTLNAVSSDADHVPCVIAIENHPNDSRVKLADDDIVQSLTSRMGTGGGNVPLVMFSKVRRAQNDHDFETWKESEITNTMNTFDRGDVRCTDAVVCKK